MFRAVIEATDESAILKNDIIDRPPIRIWGAGRLTCSGMRPIRPRRIWVKGPARRWRMRSCLPTACARLTV